MAFQFSLAPVLFFRRLVEERAYSQLEKIQQEILHVELQRGQTSDWLGLCVRNRETELAKGTSPFRLQSQYEEMLGLEQRMAMLELQLQQLRSKRTQCMKEYQEAKQRREVIEELRERQLHEYARREAKREQSALDDLFLSRRNNVK
jgi:flagellar export protein FliJ